MLLLCTVALAAFPEDPSLSAMTEHDGVRVVDSGMLNAEYTQLVAEIGTVVANQAVLPASTTGTYGFEFSATTTFVITDGRSRDGAEIGANGQQISPWDRAVPDEDAEPYLFVPTFHARKGLPLSTEIGGSVGWVGLTRTGMASIYGRVAIVEGYKPIPDITLQLGYAGYLGNEELELGVVDMGVTIGTQLPIGAAPKLNTGRFEPWANFTLLRVSAVPTADVATLEALAAQSFRGSDPNGSKPIAIPRIAGGFQITSGNVHFRLSASWAWKTLPAATAGMGFTF